MGILVALGNKSGIELSRNHLSPPADSSQADNEAKLDIAKPCKVSFVHTYKKILL